MLFVITVLIFALTAHLIITSKVTPEERDEMLKDEEMWP